MNREHLPEMITIKEAVEQTGLSEHLVRKLCTTKKVKIIKSGRKYYMNSDNLREILSNK